MHRKQFFPERRHAPSPIPPLERLGEVEFDVADPDPVSSRRLAPRFLDVRLYGLRTIAAGECLSLTAPEESAYRILVTTGAARAL